MKRFLVLVLGMILIGQGVCADSYQPRKAGGYVGMFDTEIEEEYLEKQSNPTLQTSLSRYSNMVLMNGVN